MVSNISRVPRVLVIAATLLAAACRNPAVEKQRHFEQGNRYAADHRDEFAVVEYANAVRLDPKFGEARLKLAETYERMNNGRAAAPEFIRAADALPDNHALQIKVAEILLLGGRFEDAKARAATLLAKNPKDVDALIVHANAMAALKDPSGAIAEVEEVLQVQPNASRAFVTLGTVRMHSGDAKEAESAFRKAVSLEPSAVNGHLAFANFLWSSGRLPEAEQELLRSVSLEPRHLLANRMLGALYIATNRAKEAEQPLKAVAEISQQPAARFQLAQYYIRVGRNDEATKLLTELAANQATFVDAEAMLASMDYAGDRLDAAHARLDKLLERAPKDSRPLALKAQWLASEHKLDEALDRAKAAVAADPQSAPAQYVLAVVHDGRREPSDAIAAYSEALRLNPRLVAAQVALARLNLASGDRDAALRYANEAKQTDPTSAGARVMLARSLLGQGNLARAETEIAELVRGMPNTATVHALNGMLQTLRNNQPAARTSYERALALDAGDLDAIAGLVGFDIQARRFDIAVSRVDAALTKQPDRPELLALAGRLYYQAGENDKAEQALRRAVTIDPRFSVAYSLLAQLYLKENKLDVARAEFEGMAKRDPRAAAPRTVVGIILETQGKRDEAKRWYEATVAEMSNAPLVANNLAFIYAEDGKNLDVALQLASSAKKQIPDSGNVDDTLGWVYYKKDLPQLAVKALEEALKKLPDNPNVLYHLGMTYAKTGDKTKSREALERALKLNPQLPGAASARQTLASVSQSQ